MDECLRPLIEQFLLDNENINNVEFLYSKYIQWSDRNSLIILDYTCFINIFDQFFQYKNNSLDDSELTDELYLEENTINYEPIEEKYQKSENNYTSLENKSKLKENKHRMSENRHKSHETKNRVSENRHKVHETKNRVSENRHKVHETKNRVSENRHKVHETKNRVSENRHKVHENTNKYVSLENKPINNKKLIFPRIRESY
jgi:uncharacterized coiled-coil DUF342 family protein